jgi:hypothetical protein
MGGGTMRGIGTLAMLGIIIVVVIVALGAYAWLSLSRYIHTGSVQTYKVLSANQTTTLSQLMGNMTEGFNTSQFQVSYSGNASVNIGYLQLQLPLNISVDRYNGDSRAQMAVGDIPLIGNASVVEIKNGNSYYSCSSGLNSSHRSYQCESQPASNSIFTAFNISNLGTISQGGSTPVHYGIVNQSSHNGMPCTNIDGRFNYTNSTELNSLNVSSKIGQQPISAANITFLSCISTQYRIPLTMYAYFTAKSGNTITVAALKLAETSYSRTSSSGITALPGPLVNSTR